MGGGGKDSSVDYAQSPQQQQIYDLIMPTIAQMYGWSPTGGTSGVGGGGVPQVGGAGGGAGGGYFPRGVEGGGGPTGWNTGNQVDPVTGYVSGAPGTLGGSGGGMTVGGQPYSYTGQPWGGWDVPAAPAPTADWYSNLSPDVMAGLQQPYIDAQKQGMELLGGGSARAGATGAQGAMTGNIMGDMAMNVPLQAWNMTQPGMMAEWGQHAQAAALPYTGAMAAMSGTYPEAVVQPGSPSPLGTAATAGALGMGVSWPVGIAYGLSQMK